MGDWWGSWTKNEKLLLLAGIVVPILIGVGTWLSYQGNTISQTINDENFVNQQGEINTNIHSIL